MATETTPEKVAKNATLSDKVDLDKLLLLGIIGSENDLSAFVRLPGGRIRKVATGDRLTKGRVIAIDNKGLVLERSGKTRRLDLPEG